MERSAESPSDEVERSSPDTVKSARPRREAFVLPIGGHKAPLSRNVLVTRRNRSDCWWRPSARRHHLLHQHGPVRHDQYFTQYNRLSETKVTEGQAVRGEVVRSMPARV